MNILKPAKSFIRNYLELPKETRFVCLGGGTGLSTLLSALKSYSPNICAIVTMCDEGGSTGRLRRILGVPAVGDLRNCLAALSEAEPVMQKLLHYRFAGKRYNSDNESDLGGHNLGNLLLVALSDMYGDFNKGLEAASKILNIKGKVLPSTTQDVHIWAETEDGQKIYGEEDIDLGHYGGSRTIKKLHIKPANARGFKDAVLEIKQAQVICAGPGDLYTSIMPNLLIEDLCRAVSQSRAKKILIINIANKPFETPNYKVSDYINAFNKNCRQKLFEYILVNNNFHPKIPQTLKYHYVQLDRVECEGLGVKIVEADLVDEKNPLKHDAHKLAHKIIEIV